MLPCELTKKVNWKEINYLALVVSLQAGYSSQHKILA